MNNNSALSNTDYKYLLWFFPILFIICYLQTRSILPPYGAPTDGIVCWPLRLFILYVGIKSFIRNHHKYKVLSAFIILLVFSGVFYLLGDKPITLYILSLAFYVSPMLMTYVGLDNFDFEGKFYKVLLASCVIIFFVGLYLYFFSPSWYVSAVASRYNNSWYTDVDQMRSDEWVFERARFSTVFLTSYAVSYFSMYSVPLSLALLVANKDRKKRKWYILSAIICFIASILCQQRVAMACSLFTVFLFFFLQDKKYFMYSLVLFVVIITGFYIVIQNYSDNNVYLNVIARFSEMTLTDAFEGSRSDQVVNILKEWDNPIFGMGVGSGGGEARRLGYTGITDGNFIRILYENGIVGAFLFLSMSISALIRGLRNIKYLYVETSILISILASMVGADPLSYFFYIIPFWYALGRLNNKEYLQYKIRNNLHI